MGLNPVPRYAGGSQQSRINVAGPPRHWEDGPGLMPPLPTNQEMGPQFLPPPISKTYLWGAMQTWPL